MRMRHASCDVLHGEKCDQTGLQTEPDASIDGVEGRHGLEYRHNCRKHNESGSHDVYEKSSRRRGRKLKQHVQVASPFGMNFLNIFGVSGF